MSCVGYFQRRVFEYKLYLCKPRSTQSYICPFINTFHLSDPHFQFSRYQLQFVTLGSELNAVCNRTLIHLGNSNLVNGKCGLC